MPAAPTIDELSSTLRSMSVGERSWFWFCPETDALTAPLVMVPIRSDPTMRQLRAQVDQVPLPPLSRAFFGLASMGEDGVVSLGGAGLTGDLLQPLASWVVRNSRSHPDLERLRDARLVQIEGSRVVARHADPELWLGMDVEGPQPGSLEAAAAALRAMTPDSVCWLWMTDRGPGGRPFLLLADTATTTSEAFSEQIARTRLRSSGVGRAVWGTLYRPPEGAAMFTSPMPVDDAPAILDVLVEEHGELLGPLRSARIFRMKGERRKEVLRGPDLSREVAVLAGLDSEGDAASFYFTDGGLSHPAALLLAEDRDVLKAAAKALPQGEDARHVRGVVRVSGSGWLEFRTRGEYDGFITDLAGWTRAHIGRAAGLRRLKGARMTRRDSDDRTLSRQKDDAAWG